MNNFNLIKNEPDAATLIVSMRSIGYDFNAAVADIIDNSISAGASKIAIEHPFDPDESFFLSFFDNGCGMSREELIEAMRFGTVKEEERDSTDLGRFGLGLKTASISQCRRLIVISKTNQGAFGFKWDIDVVINKRDWNMIELNAEEIESYIHHKEVHGSESFTLVVWENFDFFDHETTKITDNFSVLMNKVNEAQKECELIFHQYIEKGLEISFNGRKLRKIDPFLTNHPKTSISAPETIASNNSKGDLVHVKVQVFVLPFFKDVNSDDIQKMGGEEMWDKQGFYVYRNSRLMIYGTWFRMKKASGLSNNARIKVEIPNTLDDSWDIDVKKQKAIIPARVLEQLRKLMTNTSVISERRNRFQGEKEVNNENIWTATTRRDGSITYGINTEQSYIKNILNKLDDNMLVEVEKLLSIISLSIPTIKIHNDVIERKTINAIDETMENVLIGDAITQYRKLRVEDSSSIEDIVDRICSNKPFSSFDLKEKIIKGIKKNEN